MRESCTSGSVGGEGGNILAYPATAIKNSPTSWTMVGRVVTPCVLRHTAATQPRLLPREREIEILLARAGDRPCGQDRHQMGAEFGRSVHV